MDKEYVSLSDEDEKPDVSLPVTKLDPLTISKVNEICASKTSGCPQDHFCITCSNHCFARCMRHSSTDLGEEGPISSRHINRVSTTSNLNISYIASLRPHYVMLNNQGHLIIGKKDDLFQRLEAQYQEERKNSCKQS